MASVRRSLTPYKGLQLDEGAMALRRTEARVEGSSRARVQRGDDELDVWTLNRSRGGARLLAETVLTADEALRIRFDDEGPWHQGRVVWVKQEPDGCVAGLAFAEPDESIAADDRADAEERAALALFDEPEPSRPPR